MTTKSAASKKALSSIKQAAIEVSLASQWSWLTEIVNGSSFTWSAEKATLNSIREVKWVKWRNGTQSYVDIPAVPLRNFYVEPTQSYTNLNTYPVYYTVRDTELSFNPYPASADARAALHIFVVKDYSAMYPTVDSGTFGMPARFLDCVEAKATYHMNVRHSHDKAEAQFWQAQYETNLRRLMTLDKNLPDNIANMFGYP